jgi:hypothetical protein
MIESGVIGPMTGPTIAAQRRFAALARRHSGANHRHTGTTKRGRRKPALLLDTPLSSSPLFANSTRHSVTSRIECNSRLLCYLTFSTRHLNATLEKRSSVEKFNTPSWNFDRISIGRWWAIKDLNLGPLPCEGSALTTELIARFCNCVKRCCVDCSYSGSHLF